MVLFLSSFLAEIHQFVVASDIELHRAAVEVSNDDAGFGAAKFKEKEYSTQ